LNPDLLHQSLRDAEDGTATFPRVVETLIAAGCEGYYKDLARREVTYYLTDGTTHTERLSLASLPVPDVFEEAALIAALRAAQRDEIRYPEFILRAIKAGTAAYRVYINGRRAVYLGRKGDVYVEYFPQAKLSRLQGRFPAA
jgi:uncharacterized protein YbcV (DUF1398 family)